MVNKNLSEDHDSYLNPIINKSNGIAFSEKISYPTCNVSPKCNCIAMYRIFSEYSNTLLACENCYQKLLKAGKVKPVLKNYTNEKLPLSHKIPDARTPGFKTWISFGKNGEKKLKENLPMTTLELELIWEDREILGEECRIFGDSLPAIRILQTRDDDEYYFYFNTHGTAIMCTRVNGEFIEFYNTK